MKRSIQRRAVQLEKPERLPREDGRPPGSHRNGGVWRGQRSTAGRTVSELTDEVRVLDPSGKQVAIKRSRTVVDIRHRSEFVSDDPFDLWGFSPFRE